MHSPSARQRSAGLDIGRRAIRQQLALLVLVVTVPLLLLLVWHLVAEREQARAIAREQVKLVLDGAAGRLEASLRANEAMLSMIAAQPLVRAMNPATCDPLVKDFIRLHPEYVTIGTRDLQGNPVCTFRPDAPGQQQVAAFAWFQQSLRSGKFHVGDAFFTPLARRWVTVVTAPVFDDNKRQSGIVALPLDLLALNQVVTASAPANLLVSVIDREFNMALRSTDPQAWIGKPVPGHVRTLMQAQDEGFLSATGADGVRRLMAFKRLSGTGWRVAAGIPESEVFAAADAALRNGLLAGLALLVAALGLAWSLAQRIARPLDQLAATARRVTAGDRQARARSDATAPELAAVAAAFNHMLEALAQAQNAVRDSEENLAITLQSIGDAVIATDASGRVTRMNPAAERLCGWLLADARGRALGEVFVISDSVTGVVSLDPVQRVLSSGEVVGLANHTSLYSRDGASYQISDSAAPIRDASGQIVGVVLVFSDITEKYRLQRVLVESEGRYRALVEGSPIGVAVHRDGRYLYLNQAAVRIFGATAAADLLGRPMLERVHPDDRAGVLERIGLNLATRTATEAHGERFLRMDGSVIEVEVQAAPVSFAGRPALQVCFLDVSERKLAERALRDSEENLSITLQSIGDAVIATDASGRVTRMNPAAERLCGWLLADARGRALGEVFVISDSVTGVVSLDPVQRVLSSGEVVGLANHTSLYSREGASYQISDSAAPIRDASRQIVGVVLVFSDITEKYRLQRVLVESEGRYRALVESSPVGVAVHQQGRLVYLNPMAVRIAGAASAQQLLGRPFMEFIHPNFRAQAAERARRLVEQGASLDAMELQYIRLDGSLVEVQAQGIAISFEGQPAVQVSIVDISQRKHTERILRENEARFRALTQLSSDWYWEQDAQFRFVSVEGDFPGLHGSRNAERLGKRRWELGALNVSASDWERHRAVLNEHQEFRDFQLLRRDRHGREYWVSVSGTPIFDVHGVFRGYRGVGRDITAAKLAADQIHALAFYDALTELPNRRLLIERLKKALVTHARNHRQFALLFIDLDNFKTLNDTLGHETGDLLLRDVARRLLACVREADSVARLGGDEFVVMLEDLSEDVGEAAAQAELVCHKILAAFSTPYVLGTREYRSTPSIGITLLAQGNQGVEDLLKQADLAMYQAKAAGRNTMRLFDQGMQAAVDARVAIESELREALSASQMLLHFQPIVRSDGVVTGAEALVRWLHPSRGLVCPGEFIPVAESTRLIQPLGQWVLDTACAQLAAWARTPCYQHLTLSVNVSVHQFKEPDFVALVERALDQAGADASKLKLELTESLLADNIDEVIVKMAELRDLGIDFSLDDFGTGYSSLSYLKRLPLAQLKIDQSFVRDVLVDANDAAIARTIVALGASLGLGVVAEGVETAGQHQFLLAIGCHAFQGYFIGRPCAVAEFEAFVQASRPQAG